LREPVWTGIWIETMFGKPVGTTMTLRPFGRAFSCALNGRMSDWARVVMESDAADSARTARRSIDSLLSRSF
jgi:hypothetical protein